MNPFTPLFVPSGGDTALLNGNGLIPGRINTANGTLQFEIKVPAGALELNFFVKCRLFRTPFHEQSLNSEWGISQQLRC